VRGLGTVLNIVAILVGSTIGSLLGSRLPKRTADTITDGIGLIVLVVAAFNIVAIRDAALQAAVGTGALLIVLGAVILGGLIGSLASLETRFEAIRHRPARNPRFHLRRARSWHRPTRTQSRARRCDGHCLRVRLRLGGCRISHCSRCLPGRVDQRGGAHGRPVAGRAIGRSDCDWRRSPARHGTATTADPDDPGR
jgi:uncharacterized membrane protein YeaQ/YmgE (transglycosylase-associated protein family)